MIVVEGVETVDCEGLNTVIPGKTKLPLSHQVHIMVAIIIIIVVIFIVVNVSVAGNIITSTSTSSLSSPRCFNQFHFLATNVSEMKRSHH